ncbi:MAG: GTPase, partial [Myxococcota bacterium]
MSPDSNLPIVAIVGRPNVGKSTLFNRYAGRRRALVGDRPGITRDRIAEETEVADRRVLIVDTAGLDPDAEAGLPTAIQAQAQAALANADAILFLVDGKAGVVPDDEVLARALHRAAKPLVLAVNKIDVPSHESRVAEFHRLGFERVWGISAEHGRSAWEALEDL